VFRPYHSTSIGAKGVYTVVLPSEFRKAYWAQKFIQPDRGAVVRLARTQFGKRAISVYWPNTCNSLDPAIRNIDSHTVLRSDEHSSLINFIPLRFTA